MSLSSRVMNMKFMRSQDSQPAPEEQKSKVKDTSEWTSQDFVHLIDSSNSDVPSVGYATIHTFDESDNEMMPLTTRRQWGGKDEGIEFENIKLSNTNNKVCMSICYLLCTNW